MRNTTFKLELFVTCAKQTWTLFRNSQQLDNDERLSIRWISVNLNIQFRNLLPLWLLGSILKLYNVMQKSLLQIRIVPHSLSSSCVTWKKTARKLSRVKSWGPRSSRGHFFLAVFFRATHDRRSERGTTHSQMDEPNVLFAKRTAPPSANATLSRADAVAKM